MAEESVLLIGSAPVEVAHLTRLVARASMVICADGGAATALRAGLVPDLVVGDFDSLAAEDLQSLQHMRVTLQRHLPQKDQTDIELAVSLAVGYAPRRITLAGVLGGRRLDHGLGNIFLLTHPLLEGIDTRIDEGSTEVFMVRSHGECQGIPGEYVSLIPFSARVEGIVTQGLRYPLQDEPLLRGYTRGVSNEMLGRSATISLASGTLLVVHERLIAG